MKQASEFEVESFEKSEDWRIAPDGVSQSEAHAAECLSLWCHPQMGKAHIPRVIHAVNSFV